MKNATIIQQSKRFFKNDIFTVIVAASIVFLVAGVPLTALAAEKTPQVQKPHIQQVVAKVNINTADAKALAEVLNGVGLKKAQAIVAWREKFGKFLRIEQLMDVKGIGEKTLQRNRGVLAL